MCCATLPAAAFSAPDRLHGTPGTFGVAVCPRCGAGTTLPRVPTSKLLAFYPASYGPYDRADRGLVALASRTIQAFQGWLARRSQPLSRLIAMAPGRGVDIGCGRGDLAAMLASRGWTMTGVEPSLEACRVAGSRGIDARCGTVADVTLEQGAYDAALFRHSLEHTVDPVGDLTLVRQALRPGALVLVTVPNFGSWQSRRFRGRWYHLDVPRHRVHFTPRALESAFRNAGLEPVAMSTSSSSVGLAASVQYVLFGRCLFPGGLALRVAAGLAAVTTPLAALLAGGGGDVLHGVARRPPE